MCFPCASSSKPKPTGPVISLSYEMKQIKAQMETTKDRAQSLVIDGKLFVKIDCDGKSFEKTTDTKTLKLDDLFEEAAKTMQVQGAKKVTIVWMSIQIIEQPAIVLTAGYRESFFKDDKYTCNKNQASKTIDPSNMIPQPFEQVIETFVKELNPSDAVLITAQCVEAFKTDDQNDQNAQRDEEIPHHQQASSSHSSASHPVEVIDLTEPRVIDLTDADGDRALAQNTNVASSSVVLQSEEAQTPKTPEFEPLTPVNGEPETTVAQASSSQTPVVQSIEPISPEFEPLTPVNAEASPVAPQPDVHSTALVEPSQTPPETVVVTVADQS